MNGKGPSPSLPPKVRTDLQVERQLHEGGYFYVIKDPLTLRYFRVQELEYFIFSLLDGVRTFEEIREEVERKFCGLQVPVDTIKEFVTTLRNLNFLETFGPQGDKVLFLRSQLKRKSRLKQRLTNFFFFQLPLCDPDEFFTRIAPRLRFLWQKPFWAFWWGCLLLALGIVVTHWTEIVLQAQDFFSLRGLVLGWAIFVGIKVGHELGHGLTCKHYGGEVHELGLLFIVFTPCMYCNVSDAWTFKEGRHRLLVTLAGALTELWAASIAAILWWLTSPGMFNDLCYSIMFLCSVNNLLFNGNPLLRYDGYYALSDYLSIPNLRIKSVSYIFDALKKNLLRMQVEEKEELTERQKAIYVGYGSLSYVYRWVIMLAIIGLVGSRFYIIGVMLALVMVVTSLLLPIKNLFVFLFRNRRQMELGQGTLIPLLTAAVVAAAVLAFYQPDLKVTASCTIEPSQHTWLRVGAAGELERIWGQEGSQVRAGQPLARLSNPWLEADLKRSQLDLAITEKEITRALGLDRIAEYQQHQIIRRRLAKEIQELKGKVEKLQVLSPVSGTVLTPHLEERRGDYLQEGDLLCEIGRLEEAVIRVLVPESQVSDIRTGQPVELKAYAYPHLIFAGKVTELSPWKMESLENPALSSRLGGQVPSRPDFLRGQDVPLYPIFQVIIHVGNPDRLLRPGMTGLAKVHCGPRPLASHLWRRIQQILKPRLFI